MVNEPQFLPLIINMFKSELMSQIEIKDTSANVNLLEEEQGIAPGQACVIYSKNNLGYKVLGGGWIKN